MVYVLKVNKSHWKLSKNIVKYLYHFKRTYHLLGGKSSFRLFHFCNMDRITTFNLSNNCYTDRIPTFNLSNICNMDQIPTFNPSNKWTITWVDERYITHLMLYYIVLISLSFRAIGVIMFNEKYFFSLLNIWVMLLLEYITRRICHMPENCFKKTMGKSDNNLLKYCLTHYVNNV